MRKQTLFDHHLKAIRLLARAEVHLEFFERELEGKPAAEIVANLRSDIADYMKKRAPSQ